MKRRQQGARAPGERRQRPWRGQQNGGSMGRVPAGDSRDLRWGQLAGRVWTDASCHQESRTWVSWHTCRVPSPPTWMGRPARWDAHNPGGAGFTLQEAFSPRNGGSVAPWPDAGQSQGSLRLLILVLPSLGWWPSHLISLCLDFSICKI